MKFIAIGLLLLLAGCDEACRDSCKPKPPSMDERVHDLELKVSFLESELSGIDNALRWPGDERINGRGYCLQIGSDIRCQRTGDYQPIGKILQLLLDHEHLMVTTKPAKDSEMVLEPKINLWISNSTDIYTGNLTSKEKKHVPENK